MMAGNDVMIVQMLQVLNVKDRYTLQLKDTCYMNQVLHVKERYMLQLK